MDGKNFRDNGYPVALGFAGIGKTFIHFFPPLFSHRSVKRIGNLTARPIKFFFATAKRDSRQPIVNIAEKIRDYPIIRSRNVTPVIRSANIFIPCCRR